MSAHTICALVQVRWRCCGFSTFSPAPSSYGGGGSGCLWAASSSCKQNWRRYSPPAVAYSSSATDKVRKLTWSCYNSGRNLFVVALVAESCTLVLYFEIFCRLGQAGEFLQRSRQSQTPLDPSSGDSITVCRVWCKRGRLRCTAWRKYSRFRCNRLVFPADSSGAVVTDVGTRSFGRILFSSRTAHAVKLA
ncbi:hypothetical protein KC19_VG225900 [Ceratodon purpureus]|uniref:Uncharacterized protein n=1 Tax=Ceratodon purpureus TaxID=3225 RepID=A0A8T0HT42_CERPU|nr:hypothetical protein KC19_VG225900 [Ceratodon purpureus]